ncbi:hypothetical protein VOLCADRAFT_56687 [Volvox carteri f. nagariensis]|uniref:Glutathione S-transferase n=1 Tax=Volvox carteri f. nagariensis TaxID=3068 RepID=D8TKW9_VOLCA|nr:uncharacterized protein VOLCADRAFT_56687 [Volvox carteri f. nagariensis]EFJ51768.1 hypothetical protein VOLCADRAFT_56687 [Volvox carteri f. nagariensis]|eukprot:XP_002947178.1 hypothetical protein VOLCADRAFT_56687 [Volvox carteri f. nagariensis]
MPPRDELRLRLYADFMSQPSRAVIIFSRCNKLPVEVQPVLIHKGETRSPAYLERNPLGKVPLLEDPGAACSATETSAGDGCFRLPESAAIMSYLSFKFPELVPEHWYPRSDPVRRALVDSALHWYQGNIRAGAMRLSFHKVIARRLGQQGDERVAADGLKTLQVALSGLQSYWLSGGARPFMTGTQPSAADLLCACELEQLIMLRTPDHGTCLGEIMAPYPVVQAWRQRVRDACEPHYSDVHTVLLKAAGVVLQPAKL